jgi:hypothetical protein
MHNISNISEIQKKQNKSKKALKERFEGGAAELKDCYRTQLLDCFQSKVKVRSISVFIKYYLSLISCYLTLLACYSTVRLSYSMFIQLFSLSCHRSVVYSYKPSTSPD